MRIGPLELLVIGVIVAKMIGVMIILIDLMKAKPSGLSSPPTFGRNIPTSDPTITAKIT